MTAPNRRYTCSFILHFRFYPFFLNHHRHLWAVCYCRTPKPVPGLRLPEQKHLPFLSRHRLFCQHEAPISSGICLGIEHEVKLCIKVHRVQFSARCNRPRIDDGENWASSADLRARNVSSIIRTIIYSIDMYYICKRI